MTKLKWDQVGEKFYETGVNQGVLYIPNDQGVYDKGYAWNGLIAVTEKPSGADATYKYADNQVYLNLISVEHFGGTLEAYTYPDAFMQCDGSASPVPGLTIGQQPRKSFGLAYTSKVGNDLNSDLGYKTTLVYGALAKPTDRAHKSVNDTPDATAFNWTITTAPVEVPGYHPMVSFVLDSTKLAPSVMAAIEAILYGTDGVEPRLPSPSEILALAAGSAVTATPVAPTYDAGTKIVTIPNVTGVVYKINGLTVAAGPTAPLTKDTVVKAYPAAGYVFPDVTDDDWLYKTS